MVGGKERDDSAATLSREVRGAALLLVFQFQGALSKRCEEKQRKNLPVGSAHSHEACGMLPAPPNQTSTRAHSLAVPHKPQYIPPPSTTHRIPGINLSSLAPNASPLRRIPLRPEEGRPFPPNSSHSTTTDPRGR